MSNNKHIFLLVFVTVFFLSLGAVSALESANDTSMAIEDTVIEHAVENTHVQDTDKTTVDSNKTNKIIEKKTQKTVNSKEASKNITSFDIRIHNYVVDNSTIEVGVIDYNSGKTIPNSVLNIKLPDNSTVSTKTLKSGYVNVTMNLPYGKNVVKIEYPGTSKYYNYDYNLEINVIKRKTNLKVNVERSNLTGDVKLDLIVSDTLTGKNFKNVKTLVKLSDGRTFNNTTGTKAVASYSFKINEGRTYLNVSYAGNSKYLPVETSFYLDMDKIKKIVSYDVVLKSLYKGNTSIAVTLKDANTGKVLKNTTLKLKVFGGKTYSGKTDKNGVYTTNIEAPVGKNYMNITFAGSKSYFAHTEKINFTVKKRVTNMSFTGKDDKLNISLNDLIFKKAVANVPVTLILPNSTKVSLKTNKNGYVTYTIQPKEGTSEYTAVFKGNENLTNITRTLKVNYKPKIPVTFNVTVNNRIYKEDTVVFTLIDTKTNKGIKNAQLTIKLPSKTVQAKTNAQGQVSIRTNMSIGSNKVKMLYEGSKDYDAKNATVNIDITKRPSVINSMLYISDVFELELNLSDAINHKPLANVNIVVQHPKQTLTFKTDAYGQVRQTILLPVGTADVKIFYKGNNQYLQSNITYHNLTSSPSSKIATKVSLNNVKGVFGEKVTLTAVVTDIKSNKITGGSVVFKLNGKTLKTDNTFDSNKSTKEVSVKNGVASVTIVADKNLRDLKNLTVTYNGNSKYYKNTSAIMVAQIDLRKAALTASVSPTSQNQYKYVMFTAKVTDITNAKKIHVADNGAGYVLFKINGKTVKNSKGKDIKVKLVNGTALLKYQIPKATAGVNSDKTVKKYTVTAVYYHPNYQSVSNTIAYTVKRLKPTFVMSKTQFVNSSKTLVLNGNIQDYKKNNVVGSTELNVKINGKLVKNANKTVVYTIKNGKINLKIKVPSDVKTVSNVTLIIGDTEAYLKASSVITNVANV